MNEKKENDIFHHVTIGILIITLILTSAATIINLNRISWLNLGYGFTGAQALGNATGTSTLTINSNTQISNQVATIAFGAGYVNQSCSQCRIDSENGTQKPFACCVGWNNVTSGFLLENTGNTNISINFSCSGACTNFSFLGNGTNPAFMWRVRNATNDTFLQEPNTNDTRGSCGFDGTGWNASGWYTAVNYNDINLCGNTSDFPFDFNNTQDAFIFDINISIPVDAPSRAQQTATFAFRGTSE